MAPVEAAEQVNQALARWLQLAPLRPAVALT
jgi:hypothetical protein